MFLKKNTKFRSKVIKGTNEDDNIIGSEKSDIIFGRNGNDILNGWCGNDIIFGSNGNDTIYGANGNDIAFGGNDNDNIYGGKGNDKLFGDKGNDKIKGEEGNDFIFAGKGVDYLYGASGNDKLFGGEDNDKLFGDDGNDFLSGGNGNDFLYGGLNNDKYSFRCNFGCDVIYDESGTSDTIDFNNIKHNKLAFLKNGDDLVIGYKNNIVEVKEMFSSDNTHQIENIEAKCGYHLDTNAINEVVSIISSYSKEQGCEFNHINQVQEDKNLMNLIANAWIN